MAESPLVSVVLPFCNAKSFIAEAVDSVLAQEFESWELLLVDDGATDGSTDIAKGYAEGLPTKVRYLEHDGHVNRGVSASRNLGIRNGRGAYVAFLDADDVWMPRKLRRQISLMASHPEVGFVYGLSEWWYSWSGEASDRGRDFVHRLGVPVTTPIDPPELLWRWVVNQDAAIPNPSNILVRRQVAESVGAFEESFVGNAYEDQAFLAKIAFAVPGLAADECWDRYRQHPGSSVATAERCGQAATQRLFFLTWLAQYLEHHGWRHTPLWRSLAGQAWAYRHPRLEPLLAASRSLPRLLLGHARATARRLTPAPILHAIRARRLGSGYSPPPGAVRFGHFRRQAPVSRQFGYDRGQPIDRYYIECFLGTHRADVKGRVLEVADDTYTRRFGGDRVTQGDVLDVDAGNTSATIIASLERRQDGLEGAFDCVILTQTLQFIYDVPTALSTVHALLKPGGVLLATVPGISQISRYDMDRWGDYWRFTTRSSQRLCEQAFPGARIAVAACGNVFSAAAFLYGLSSGELGQNELDYVDPDYEVVITIRVQKRGR